MPTRDDLKLALMTRACSWVDEMDDAEVAATATVDADVEFRGEPGLVHVVEDSFPAERPGLTEVVDPHTLFVRHIEAINADLYRDSPGAVSFSDLRHDADLPEYLRRLFQAHGAGGLGTGELLEELRRLVREDL